MEVPSLWIGPKKYQNCRTDLIPYFLLARTYLHGLKSKDTFKCKDIIVRANEIWVKRQYIAKKKLKKQWEFLRRCWGNSTLLNNYLHVWHITALLCLRTKLLLILIRVQTLKCYCNLTIIKSLVQLNFASIN